MLLNKDLQKVLNITIKLSKEHDYKKLLTDILEEAMEISNADGGTLYLLDNDELKFFFMVTKSLNIKNGGNINEIDLPPVNILSQSVAALSAREKTIINVSDVYTDTKYNFDGPKKYDSITGYHTKSVLVLPLLDRDNNVLGVMQLINAYKDNEIIEFSKDIEKIIYSLASLSGILLNNMELYDNIKELLDSFVNAMVKAIESRTPYNAFHTINVAKICISFIDYLNNHGYEIKDSEKEELYLAAMLHDVGKMIIPLNILNKATRFEGKLDNMLLRYDLIDSCICNDYFNNKLSKEEYEKEKSFIQDVKEFIIKLDKMSFLDEKDLEFIELIKNKSYDTKYGILNILDDNELEDALIKKGTLTKLEREEIEKHVIYTKEILGNINFGKKYMHVKDIACNHHEYLNGTGYPNHKSDNELSLLVRIITIVDIYESLISTDRPYKKPMPKDKALFILNEMVKEGKLDSTLVNHFSNMQEGL